MTNKIEITRELRSVLSMILNALDRDAAEGKSVRGEMAQELRALLAAEPVDANAHLPYRVESLSEFLSRDATPVVERQPVVIDLDAVDWETIQQAADESNWMPNEYMRNEWVADVCNFLKYGRADTSQPAPVAVVLPEPIYQVEYRGDGGGGWVDVDKESYDMKAPHPKHWRTRIVYACLDKVKELNQ